MAEMKRVFLLRDADGRNVDVVATLHRIEGNRSAHFSVTSQNGAAHEQILAAATDEVADDLRTLVQAHLRDEDGTPMHAVENAAYHLREGRYQEAVASLGGGIDPERLGGVKVKAEIRMQAEGAAEVERVLNKPLVDAAKAVLAMDEQVAKAERDGRSFAPYGSRARAVFAFDAVEKGKEAPRGLPENWQVKLALLEEKGIKRLVKEVAEHGAPKERVKRATDRVSERFLKEAVAAFAADEVAAGWRATAAQAKGILAKPDYRVAGRPEVDRDDTTFEGFAILHGLGVEPTFLEDSERLSTKWKVDLTKDGEAFHRVDWTQGAAYGHVPPDVTMIMESLQSDVGAVFHRDEDEFVDEMGFAESARTLRKGLEAYRACKDLTDTLRANLGEETFRHFMTKVGDNPPLSDDSFAEPASIAP